MHICLRTDDIHADVERIRGEGIPIDVEVKMGLDHNLQAWITDPDGNRIELMQLSEASPQRETARMEADRRRVNQESGFDG
jgi:lactoylglutathione lyase